MARRAAFSAKHLPAMSGKAFDEAPSSQAHGARQSKASGHRLVGVVGSLGDHSSGRQIQTPRAASSSCDVTEGGGVVAAFR